MDITKELESLKQQLSESESIMATEKARIKSINNKIRKLESVLVKANEALKDDKQ